MVRPSPLRYPLAALLLATSATATPRMAEACGCFAAPTAAQPVLQAGERIVFARADDRLVMHIEIQYEGDAADFAWLVPVPEVPEVRVGTEELFAGLEEVTAPQFLLQNTGAFFCGAEDDSFGCGSDDASAEAVPLAAFPPSAAPEDPSVVVEQSEAGPYEYAVVRADSLEPMLRWLEDNRYFVPTDSNDALQPYVGPGKFFVAFRLSPSATTGDIQPVVLEFTSELPMIPITLTQIGAVADMGILVWVLGEHRAIPRNYYEVIINEEYINWQDPGPSYQALVARAVDEAPNGHGFVTEMAGSTEALQDRFEFPRGFGAEVAFEATQNLQEFVNLVWASDIPPSAIRPFWERNYPMPRAAREQISADLYYQDLPNSLRRFDPQAGFDAAALTEDLFERVVGPLLEAQALFDDHSYVTRLYTALSPEEMNADPVFEENPDLGEVPRLRSATLQSECGDDDELQQFLVLSDGRRFQSTNGGAGTARQAPSAARVQVARAEGESTVLVDNAGRIQPPPLDDGGGCRVGSSGSRAFTMMVMFALVFAGRGRWGRA